MAALDRIRLTDLLRKSPASAEEAARFASAFDREDRDEIGRRAPFLGMFPLRMWRRLRGGR